jgi:hypothetical protein
LHAQFESIYGKGLERGVIDMNMRKVVSFSSPPIPKDQLVRGRSKRSRMVA